MYRILDRKLIRVSYFEGIIIDCQDTYEKVRVFSYFQLLLAQYYKFDFKSGVKTIVYMGIAKPSKNLNAYEIKNLKIMMSIIFTYS